MQLIEPVEITLDRPRKMLLTLGALRRADQEFNKARGLTGDARVSIFDVINTELKNVAADNLKFGPDLIAIMLWASLLNDDPNLTLDDVDKFAFNPVGVVAKVIECINNCFLKSAAATAAGEQEGDRDGRPLDRPNGLDSGHSPESSSV